jgi:hypothetical protein
MDKKIESSNAMVSIVNWKDKIMNHRSEIKKNINSNALLTKGPALFKTIRAGYNFNYMVSILIFFLQFSE